MRYSFFILFFTLILSVSIPTQAQDKAIFDVDQLGKNAIENVLYTFQTEKIKGSPYMNDHWVQGHVIIDENTKSGTVYLRFNSYQNQVEFARDEQAFAINSSRIDGFVMYASDGQINFRNGFKSEEHDIDPSTLLRVVQDGKVDFLCHHKTKLKEEVPAYGSATKKNEFKSDRDYYIVDSSGTFHKIKKLKEKHVLKALGDKKKELRQFAESNNLDFSEESDIARIVAYYNKQVAS